MRSRIINLAIAATVTAALAVALKSPIAHAATDDRAPAPISTVLSNPSPLAATPVAVKNRKSGKYLQPSSTANNAVVRQQSASSTTLQGWVLINDSGYVTLWNYGVNRNLGTLGASTAPDTSAVIVNGSGSYDQDWLIAAIDDTYFRLKNRKDTSKCLGIDGGSTANGARAAIYACGPTIAPNQTWSFTTF